MPSPAYIWGRGSPEKLMEKLQNHCDEAHCIMLRNLITKIQVSRSVSTQNATLWIDEAPNNVRGKWSQKYDKPL